MKQVDIVLEEGSWEEQQKLDRSLVRHKQPSVTAVGWWVRTEQPERLQKFSGRGHGFPMVIRGHHYPLKLKVRFELGWRVIQCRRAGVTKSTKLWKVTGHFQNGQWVHLTKAGRSVDRCVVAGPSAVRLCLQLQPQFPWLPACLHLYALGPGLSLWPCSSGVCFITFLPSWASALLHGSSAQTPAL